MHYFSTSCFCFSNPLTSLSAIFLSFSCLWKPIFRRPSQPRCESLLFVRTFRCRSLLCSPGSHYRPWMNLVSPPSSLPSHTSHYLVFLPAASSVPSSSSSLSPLLHSQTLSLGAQQAPEGFRITHAWATSV